MKTFFNKPSSKDLLHIPQNLSFGTSPQAIRFKISVAGRSFVLMESNFTATNLVASVEPMMLIILNSEISYEHGYFLTLPFKTDHSFSSFCSCWFVKNQQGVSLLRNIKPSSRGQFDMAKLKRPTHNCSILHCLMSSIWARTRNWIEATYPIPLFGLVCLRFSGYNSSCNQG